MRNFKKLEELGRVRLSHSFFMRDFLHSEISQLEGIPNIPIDPDLAIEAGKGLCQTILEPIQSKLGKISIRSAYRSPEVNRIGNEKQLNCASNDRNRARHIWDLPDESGQLGATACVVVNSFVDYYDDTGDWPALAWWICDHIDGFRDIMFFPKLAAFNINWYSGPVKEQIIASQMPDPLTSKKGILTKSGMDNFSIDHSCQYERWLRLIE